MKIEKLFSGVIALNPTYHGWPTVVRIRGEELLAVCSGNRERHVCPFGRVFLYRSADGGKTWTGPRVLSNGPLDDRDAGICVTANGWLLVNYFTSTLALFQDDPDKPAHWIEQARALTKEQIEAEHGLWMLWSADGGHRWAEKIRIPVNSPHGPTLLKDGRLFFIGKPASDSLDAQQHGTLHAPGIACAISGDNGRTWKLVGPVRLPAGHDPAKCHEPYAIEAPDGRIIAQIRDHNDPDQIRTWQTESADCGLTWTEPHLICDGFPTHLLRFGGDRLLMTYGWRKKPFGIRARVSDDSARTWGEEIVISDSGLTWDIGYPSSAAMPDGSIFTLWYEFTGKVAQLKYCRWKLAD